MIISSHHYKYIPPTTIFWTSIQIVLFSQIIFQSYLRIIHSFHQSQIFLSFSLSDSDMGISSDHLRQEEEEEEELLTSPSTLPLLSLNHVSYVCKSVMESAEFYQQVLGFVLIKRPSSFNFEGAWLFNYGIGIHLLQSNNSVTDRQKPLTINPKDNHISFQCTDISLVKRKLEAMGMKYESAIVEEGGITVDQLFFHDPDGYMIEICNCENLPVLPLSAACPLKIKPSSISHTADSTMRSRRSFASMKALRTTEMESRMMENLVADMINITM